MVLGTLVLTAFFAGDLLAGSDDVLMMSEKKEKSIGREMYEK
jgi:hypothetical protein